jgi:hypothetical protein
MIVPLHDHWADGESAICLHNAVPNAVIKAARIERREHDIDLDALCDCRSGSRKQSDENKRR